MPDASASRPTRRLWPYGLAGAALLPGLAGLAVWLQRAPVTDLVVRRYLAANGVGAQARTVQVGSDRLVFDAVRLGPATAPDLTARRVTIDLGWSRLTPAVRAVRLDGAVLRMRAGGSGISFGSLDRLIPPGRSTRFPALALSAQGAVIRVATPAGELVWRVDGDGRLDRDFRAVARLAPAALQRRDCGGSAAATVTIATRATRFDAAGTGSVQGIACRGVAVPRLDWRATLAAPLSLDSLQANAALTLSGARWQAVHSGSTSVSAAASGSPGALSGTWQLHGVDLGRGGDRAATFTGSGRLRQRDGGLALSGSAAATGLALGTAAAAIPDASGWPTLAARLVDRLRLATHAVVVKMLFDAAAGNDPAVRIGAIDAVSASGLRVRFAGAGIAWSPAATSVDGSFEVSGTGLPAVRGDVASRRGVSTGSFAVAPWHSGGDALGIGAGRFSIAPRAMTLHADVLLSSRIAGGSVEALRLPLAVAADPVSGAVRIGDGCAPVSLGRAGFGTTVAGPLALKLCPAAGSTLLQLSDGRLHGDVILSALTARGSFDGQPATLAARPLRLTLAGTAAAPVLATPAATLTATFGAWRGDATVAASLSHTGRGWEGNGTLSDVDAAGPAVTLNNGSGHWQLAPGVTRLSSAAATIIDPGATPRFAPLRLQEFAAELDAGRVKARGIVKLATGPDSATAPVLATVAGSYDLAARTGRATLDSTLAFSPALQPFKISELARGIVANVTGKAVGHADLTFTPAGAAGTGQVRLDNVSLATAALGPVSAINGTVAFDDLVSLHTPPHQTLHIGAVDPGIGVEDIAAEFQLLGPGRLAVERLRWPFTGGTMTLQPTIIESGAARRTFTVVVDGLDAQAFLQRFELKNLSATGRFDGVLPLVFDGAAGRIEGGVLSARTAGGLLQYVGDVGQANMGAAGRLAFDALRKLRYRTLTLRLDGDLDGELVTGINFTGTNELPIRPAGKLPIRAAGLPFKFGVTVRAPFRALLGTAASFSDARTVIRAAKPAP